MGKFLNQKRVDFWSERPKMPNRLVLLLTLISACNCAKLPSYFMKCSKEQADFNVCFAKAIEYTVRLLDHPIPEIGLPDLNPLEIPSLTIDAGSGVVAFSQNYKNLKITGFNNLNCSKAEADFSKGTIFVKSLAPSIKMDFDYKIQGRILVLPIYGDGPGSITLDNVEFYTQFVVKEYRKRNKAYYKVVQSEMRMNPGHISFDLKNLFNGDKMLGDTILQVMNENWKEVFADVRASYESAFAQVFAAVFNRLLARVPSNELFS